MTAAAAERTTMKITLPTTDKGYCLAVDTTIRYQDRKFHVGVVPAGREGRQEFQGPIVPGPWGFVNPTVICISAWPQPADTSIAVEEGDLLVIDGTTYRLRDQRATNRSCNDHWLAIDVVPEGE